MKKFTIKKLTVGVLSIGLLMGGLNSASAYTGYDDPEFVKLHESVKFLEDPRDSEVLERKEDGSRFPINNEWAKTDNPEYKDIVKKINDFALTYETTNNPKTNGLRKGYDLINPRLVLDSPEIEYVYRDDLLLKHEEVLDKGDFALKLGYDIYDNSVDNYGHVSYERSVNLIPSKRNRLIEKGTLRVMTHIKSKIDMEIPFSTIEEKDNTLEKGKKVVKTKGENGLKEVYTKYKEFDEPAINDKNKEHMKEFTEEVVVKQPVNEIVLVGTKEPEIKKETKKGTSVTTPELPIKDVKELMITKKGASVTTPELPMKDIKELMITKKGASVTVSVLPEYDINKLLPKKEVKGVELKEEVKTVTPKTETVNNDTKVKETKKEVTEKAVKTLPKTSAVTKANSASNGVSLGVVALSLGLILINRKREK